MPLPDATEAPGWSRSALPREILRLLERSQTVESLAGQLQVTDARVLWYMEKLLSVGYVQRVGDSYVRTASGSEALRDIPAEDVDVTVLPGRTVYDFRQAFADAAAGMFGEDYVQVGGEHGSRLSSVQAEEFRARLADLIAEYFAPGRGDRTGTKYGFHWVLTPTDLHPLSDG